MKLLFVLTVLLPLAASAATSVSGTWNVSTLIPDNDDAGVSDTRTLAATGIDQITSVTVNLNITGGWNGDLYAYLSHGDTGFAVLLNRPGRTATQTDGSATVGLSITLDDSAFADIHTAIPLSGGLISGIYQPDGRNIDPFNVVGTDARTAMLSSFTGFSANGMWTLFVADQSPGDTSILQNWSLTVTGVPEPASAMLAVLGILTAFRRRREAPISPAQESDRPHI